MFDCAGTLVHHAMCNTLTGTTINIRTFGTLMFDGFRDVIFNAEWMRLSERGQNDVGMVNKRSSETLITREDMANMTTAEPGTLTITTMFSSGFRFVLTATMIATQMWYQRFRDNLMMDDFQSRTCNLSLVDGAVLFLAATGTLNENAMPYYEACYSLFRDPMWLWNAVRLYLIGFRLR